MRKKLISGVLSAAMLLGVAFPATPGYAAEEPSATSGMEISKTAVANGDGTYTITLEAYATGSKVITESKEDVPTDIVLVLDQSGSMEENMSTYSFRAYTNKSNSAYYNLRHNNSSYNATKNLYYQLDDGSYASVSVTRAQGEATYSYVECPSNWVNDAEGSWGSDPDDYWKYSNDNLFVKNAVDEYEKVTLTRSGSWWDGYTYTYTFPDGSTVVSEGRNTSPENFNGKGPLYRRSISQQGEYTYTYTYTDKDGVTQTIGTSAGANTQPTGFTLYERYQASRTTRLQALKNAVTTFANGVAEKAAGADKDITTTEDNVNHRIAVVGFASGTNYNGTNYNYGNTEVFVGSNQYKYGTAAEGVYDEAFQDMNTAEGKANVTASIGALDANGGTIINLGMEMANGIFEENPVGENEKRNRVVIVFTDGTPGWSGYDSTVANNAITEGNTSKNTYKATVYTVGIFEGADATSAGSTSGTDTAKANWFMQNLSNNNGTPQSPSYYLSAGDADSLNNIFQQISNQIQSGGSSTTLSEETVIKDIIAPAFTLPAGTKAEDITVETYECIGKSGEAYTWRKNATTMGATAAVSGDKVDVTGFDFAENYVGTVTQSSGVTYRGHKLVISFDVVAKDGFLGGNNVYTNTSAGVYENDEATSPALVFNRPQVNVPIKDVSVTAADKNVYLTGSLNAAQLQAGATVTAGKTENSSGISLNMDEYNYGLEVWQNEYVNIGFKDADGNATTELENLKADTSYTVSVTIDPKSDGAGASGAVATKKTGSDSADVYVFKPYATFKDSTIYQGNKADYAVNKPGSVIWVHGTTESTDPGVTMTGDEPKDVSYTYDKAEAAFQDCTTVQPTPVVNGISGGSATSFTVHVLKPSVVVNLADTSAYYGTTYTPAGGSAVVSWSDSHTGIPTVTGTAPFDGSNVTLKYYDSAAADATVKGAFTMTKQPVDIYVKAFHGADQLTVTGYNTTCNVPGYNCAAHTNGYYTVHPLTCQLTITKKDGAAGEPYVFDIYKDDVKYSEVTIVGNGSETIYELPVGEYTVKEDTSWSWRYDASYSSEVTLSSGNTSGEITCTNASNGLIYWLNGFSQVLKNIFGIGQN